MSVIKVLSTSSVSAGTVYATVQTGYYRVIATAGDATISFNDGPAITVLQDEALLINSGAKPGASRILKATNAATAVYTCLLYTSPSPRDGLLSRMPSSA